jgi:hypothetical protein
MERTTYEERFRVHDVDWVPLERFFCDADAPELASFGFAGHLDRPKGGSIRMYMNLDTRHLLLIDDQLECYRLSGNRPKRVSRHAALTEAYAGIDDLDAHELRAVPRSSVFPCRHNAWGDAGGAHGSRRQRHLRVVS